MNPVTSGSSPVRRWAAETWAVALYDFRRQLPNVRSLGKTFLLFTPTLLAVLLMLVRWATAAEPFTRVLVLRGDRVEPGADLNFLAQAFLFFDLKVVVYLVALLVFGSLYHGEIAERTLHHLFLMPVRREVTALGKYLAGVLLLWSTSVVAWWATVMILLGTHGAGVAAETMLGGDGLVHLLGFTGVLLLATLAYGALFLLFGALVKAPVMLAAMFWAWEAIAVFLPVGFQRFTIAYWLASAMPVSVPPDSPIAATFQPAPGLVAIPVLLLTSAALVALAILRVRRIELSYGASD